MDNQGVKIGLPRLIAGKEVYNINQNFKKIV